MKRSKNVTKTSSFGYPGRMNHNSTNFYLSRLYEELPKEVNVEYFQNELHESYKNKIFCVSSENMRELPDSSEHLVVTSHPSL